MQARSGVLAFGAAVAMTLSACSSQPGEPVTPSTAVAQPSSSQPSQSASAESPSPSPSGPVVLTKPAAAQRYLAFVCPANAATDKLNKAIRQESVSAARPSARTQAAAKRAFTTFVSAAKGLTDEAFVWPKSAATPVSNVAADYYEDSVKTKQISNGKPWAKQSAWGKKSNAASKARLALGLPPRSGKAGC